jgi:hypothetical protein
MIRIVLVLEPKMFAVCDEKYIMIQIFAIFLVLQLPAILGATTYLIASSFIERTCGRCMSGESGTMQRPRQTPPWLTLM